MTNEDLEILSLHDVPLGYEPLILSDAEADGLASEYRRLRGAGRAVVLCDNGDGTLGLWELRGGFWIDP